MTRTPTARPAALALIAIAGLTGALALGRPELAVVAAPAGAVLVAALLTAPRVRIEVVTAVEPTRVVEGGRVRVAVSITSTAGLRNARLVPVVPAGLAVEAVDGAPAYRADSSDLILRSGDGASRLFDIECARWGRYRLLGLRITGSDFLGMFDYRSDRPAATEVHVFPNVTAIRRLFRPVETQLGAGEVRSQARGGGLEFAELRPFVPGDDPRRIDWRASARRGSPWVAARHPERNSDLVLLVDTLAEPHRDDPRTLDHVVKAAAALAAAHLGRRDRVGLLVFGGMIHWLRPRMFDAQRYRIFEALIDSRLRLATDDRPVLPVGSLPPQALVVGLSPLLDDQVVGAFAEVRGRGFDLAIVEVSADAVLPEPVSRTEELARRIWDLQRDATRRRFRRRGVAVARWDPHEPFSYALAEVAAFRRTAARRRH